MDEKGDGNTIVEPSTRMRVEPPGKWVTGLKNPPPEAGETSTDSPTDQLLLERQLFPKKSAQFSRHAQRLNTPQGVEALSQVRLDFDPATEQLLIHSIRIWRDGTATEHADPSRIKIIQRETNLERQLYDGRMSALLLLEDVRVGDVIDIASTRIVDHPELTNHFNTAIAASHPVPVARWSVSALVEEGSPLRWQLSPEDKAPQSRELKGGWTLHRWEQESLPASKLEVNAPTWELQAEALEFTSFADWAEVAHWVAGLWGKADVPDALKDIARDILGQAEDETTRADLALAFVRDEVRYLGIEEGIGSLQPSPVADVLRRRFGDCKDKSRLLCTLFRLLKIPAAPMLVNTALCGAIEELLPSAGAFDHVIVCAQIDGKAIWIDPTRRGLAKSVLELPPPNYGFALPVSAKAKGLRTIPPTPAEAALLVVKETYSIKHPDNPVELTVEQTASGYEADHLRELYGTLGNAKVREWREGQIRDIYPKSRAIGDWERDLDSDVERVTTIERFEIEDFALKGGDGTRAAPFGPNSLRARFPGVPDETERQTSWALPFPCRIRHEVHFDLPFTLPPDQQQDQVDSETFGYKSKLAITGEKMQAVYRYWSKSDHVAPEQIDTFRKDVAAMSKSSTHLLQFPVSHDVWRKPEDQAPAPERNRERVKIKSESRDRHHGRQKDPKAARRKLLNLVGTVVVLGTVVGLFAKVMNQGKPPKPASTRTQTLAPEDEGYQKLFGNPADDIDVPLLPTGDTPAPAPAGASTLNPGTSAGKDDSGFNGSLLDFPTAEEPKEEDPEYQDLKNLQLKL